MDARNWHKWFVLPLLGLALSARPIACDYTSITDKFGAEAVALCNQKCPFQNRTGDGHFDLSCGADCSMQQCLMGCNLWQYGLEHSCQTSCNATSETVFSRELYCVIGCNEALNTYFQKLRDLIGTPTAPALVADSLTPTSLSLVWEAPTHSNLSYLLQWRYEELPGSWQYYNGSDTDGSIIQVWNLQPYTKYRFRVAIFLSGRTGTEPIYSAPSVVISTLEKGKPSSEPSFVRAAAPDPSRIAISWEPGQFANGPLIGYVLRLVDTQPNVFVALKDMPASNNTLFYMFQNLVPAREYEVSVAMRNAVGEGPKKSVKVSTPPLPVSIPQQPILIIGGKNNILAAPANDMLSDPIELYSTRDTITGVGLDISSDYLFVSDSSGHIHRSSLSKKSESIPILTPQSISYKPHDLSVDWLNRHLYVLGEVQYTKSHIYSESHDHSSWEILRCDFDGQNQLVALSGFNSRPIHFEVDPYNGYLFWAIRDGDRGGLYRLDLANISNGVRHDTPPELIVRDANLGAFTVDHADFRLLVAHSRKNNILAVSLDGHEVTNFRSNTQTPMFMLAQSIAYANGLFYWTNGKDMLTEEYHRKSDNYFHNEYPVMFNMKVVETKQVLVNLRSCQPVPVPVNPPIALQSVMGINKAKVSWSPPHLLGHQGIGAWQRWEFHLQFQNVYTGEVLERKTINGSSYVMDGLREDTEYVIKVAAVTNSGSGPWSSEFVGKSLSSSSTTLNSSLIWSGPDGLFETDVIGDKMRTLIHKSDLNRMHITDISWYNDMLYLVTNASTVLWYNTTSHTKGVMPSMENVGSLAVDWVGKRLYWSNPKQQLITRSNLQGGNREPVPIVTVAKELTIDSLEAYIYWNTGHAVEAARLNGENKMVYYPAQLFSGKQVMGLATDLENRWLYWLVRSYDGSELHRAPTAERIQHIGHGMPDILVNKLPGTQTMGPLCYWSSRLLWIQNNRAVVSDLAGQYTAKLGHEVYIVSVKDPTTRLPEAESLIAIPETINASSITVIGNWTKFDVTWAPSHAVNVTNGRVHYDVSVLLPNYEVEKTVDVPWLEIRDHKIPPYSNMEVTVRAHTHWGGGAAAKTYLKTPQAPPTEPQNPRIYVQPAHTGGYLTAIFRWESPSLSNGIIRGYETQCWLVPDGSKPVFSTRPSACADAVLPPGSRQLMLKDHRPAHTYYFQVRAYTDAGYGPYSEIVSASSDVMNPIPKVMISSQEAIKIVDLDSGDSELIPKSTSIPIDFALSIEENTVYWVNNFEEIFSSRIDGSGHFKQLTSINGSATSLCVDWISRSVYWAQLEMASTDLHVMYRADIGPTNTRPHITRLFATKQQIYGLQIVPVGRSLYWYVETTHPGLGTLMTAHIDGSSMRQFFNNTFKNGRSDCNCPDNPQISKSFSIDLTNRTHEIYWVDPWTHQILATDMYGCKCRVIVDAPNKKYGFTPMSITVDSKYVYWYNSTEQVVYYTTKNVKSKIEQFKASYGYKILALDAASQPYPPRHCLFPESDEFKAKLLNTSANSLILELPNVGKIDHCNVYEHEMPLTEYTVYYHKYSSSKTVCDKETCPYVTTTEKHVTLTDLDPFTNYSVMLEATNYYARLHEVKPVVGETVKLQTAAEAPRPARDVTATVLSPVLARVEWTPEPGLWYELHWRTDDSASTHKFKEHNTVEVSEGRVANMTRLSPGTTYWVWVRARSDHSSERADSKEIQLKTPPNPNPLVFVNQTSTTLRLRWKHSNKYMLKGYRVEYSELTASKWLPCSHVSDEEWTATDLQPSNLYKFRLRLQYTEHAPYYFWPHDDRFTNQTLGDVPAAPGEIRAEAVDSRVLRAKWTEPDPRGPPVDHYRVWGRPVHRVNDIAVNTTADLSDLASIDIPDDVDDDLKKRIINEGLELLHNGTEKYWLISGEELVGRYIVWVQAHNSVGWGALSRGAELSAPGAAIPTNAPALAAAAAAAALAVAALAALLYMYKNRVKKKPMLESHIVIPMRRGPDVELATLRELPTRHSTNIIYNRDAHQPSHAELASLSHIRREQISLTKFLGSGAFGEVFEGVAIGLGSGTTRVAVKTLRKSATEQEKSEFLQEAALMSNFKHDHILALVGVCLDNDPHYIIMELMEEGDLLSYLRAKRPALYSPDSLTLLDLLNMCVDVTKGCRYLEEMHFVHRDLACRNCLVAHRPSGRVVKIGDFGLARDIYKNDYYRKEGEGLLPVRWMAVECLMDGVFSCQSDVWAWAVLCWEVVTLGRQPYPARNNREVLAYVRAGGKPDRPPNCPSVLYELMQRCWSYSPDDRPSFKECLDIVTELRDKTSPNITLTATAGVPQYLTLLADDAVENRTYLLDENDNAFMDEEFPEQEMEASRPLPEIIPKYIELMYDTEPACVVGDGYEIPRTFQCNRLLMPGSRHSIVGVASNRLIKPPLYRTHSLRTNLRPANATITPLRNGITKRASLCEGSLMLDPTTSVASLNESKDHDQTPF